VTLSLENPHNLSITPLFTLLIDIFRLPDKMSTPPVDPLLLEIKKPGMFPFFSSHLEKPLIIFFFQELTLVKKKHPSQTKKTKKRNYMQERQRNPKRTTRKERFLRLLLPQKKRKINYLPIKKIRKQKPRALQTTKMTRTFRYVNLGSQLLKTPSTQRINPVILFGLELLTTTCQKYPLPPAHFLA
jgi:hypothetical protein